MNKSEKNVWATIAALVAHVIFGLAFLFTKIALESASPMVFIADRYVIAFLGLTLVMVVRRKWIRINKNIWKVILMSFFQPVLYFIFETYGIDFTTSSFSSVMISLTPIMSMIFGMFFLREVPSPMQYVFSAMSVAGIVIIALLGKADGTVTLPGVFLLLGAVLSSVGYNVTSRKIAGEFDAFERTYVMAITGMISFVLIAVIENINNPVNLVTPFLTPSYVMSILFLAIVSSIIAYFLLNYANTYMPVAKTTAFSNITTVVSVLAGAVFLDEKLTLVSVGCILMIIAGVWGVQRLGVREKIEGK